MFKKSLDKCFWDRSIYNYFIDKILEKVKYWDIMIFHIELITEKKAENSFKSLKLKVI
jgi:hypothetical protein